MPRPHRRTATKVQDGRVRKKNDWTPASDDYLRWTQSEIRIDRRDPGPGSRHLVTVDQLRGFLELLPDWAALTVGLDAIVLATRRGDGVMGWCTPGVVALCAWEADLWWSTSPGWVERYGTILGRLEVDRRRHGGGVELRFTEAQARAFQLLDVLPHELGHHHDRMTTRRRRNIGGGEPYAEAYALRVLDEVYEPYVDAFGV